jgi:outer membrane receptor for ferrienterochelin and colicins
MGNLRGFPCPPAPLHRQQSWQARARAKPKEEGGRGVGPECRRPPHAITRRVLWWCVSAGFLVVLGPMAVPAARGDGLDTTGLSATPDEAVMADVSLDDLLSIVITSTKAAQSTTEAPSVIEVITEKEIREYGYRSVAEALSHISGIYVRDDLIHPNVSMRGIDSGLRSWSRDIKVLINSQPVAYRGDTSNWLGPGLIPMDAIAQIEVIRGPGSALYGANAYLGIVNIITKKAEVEHQVMLSAGAGFMSRPCPSANKSVTVSGSTYDTCSINDSSVKPAADGSMVATQQVRLGRGLSLEYLLSSGISYADRSGLLLPATSPYFVKTGNRYFQGIGSDITSANDTDSSASFYGSAKLSHGSWGSLTLDGLFNRFETFGEFTDWSVLTHGNRVSMQNWYGKLTYAKSLRSLPVDLSLSYALAGGGYTGRNRLEIVRDSSFWVRKDGGYLGHDLAAEARWLISKRRDVYLTVGVTISIDNQDLPSIYAVESDPTSGQTTTVPSYLLNEKLFVDSIAIAQLSAKPLAHTGVIAGVSYDWQNIYAKSCSFSGCPGLNTRLGIVQTLFKNGSIDFYAKALFGSSFKSPPAELIYGTPYVLTGISGNNQLKPEMAKTWEFVLGGKFFRWLDVQADGFYTLIQKRIEYVQSGDFIKAVNSGNAHTVGIEGSAAFHHKTERHTVGAYANVSWQRTQMKTCLLDDAAECDRLMEFNYLYPSTMAKGGLSYSWRPLHMSFALDGTYVGSRLASQSNRLNNLPDYTQGGFDHKAYRLPSYLLLNLRLSSSDLRLFRGRETVFSIAAHNLLNSGIVEPGFNGIDTPGLGRIVMLTIKQGL